MKKRILLSNMYDETLLNDVRDNLLRDCADDISEEDIWETYNQEQECNWECDKYMLSSYFETCKHGFLGAGSVSRWDGLHTGYQPFESLNDVLSFMKDASEIEIWDEKGHLMVNGYHHDGVYSLQIKALTKRGKEYLENTGNAAKCFADSHYTNLPHAWKKMYA